MSISAGILVYRKAEDKVEFFLVKPGGPFYKNADDGIWTFPKGELNKNESELDAAKREFKEETSLEITSELKLLDTLKLRKGKNITAFYCKQNLNAVEIDSSTFEMEHPKNSGVLKSFKEIEKADWFTIEEAKIKAHPKIYEFIKQLNDILNS